MPDTIVVKGGHGLPYSKGLMAQSLSASGVAPERAYDVARALEARLADSGRPEIDAAELRELAAEVLREREGGDAARRFLEWEGLDRLGAEISGEFGDDFGADFDLSDESAGPQRAAKDGGSTEES